MNTLRIYTFNSKKVVLVASDTDVKGIALEMAGGLLAVPVDALRRCMREDEIEAICQLSYDDLLAGDYFGGEIVSTYIVNPENEHTMIEAFVSREYAETDEAEREILVDTTPYHNWRSLRTKTKEALYDAISKAMQEHGGDEGALHSLLRSLHADFKDNWLNDCNGYAHERLDIDLEEEFNAMWRCAEAEVSSNIGYVPDIDYE